jgi:hypothetical protein
MAAPSLCGGPGIADPRGRLGVMDWRLAATPAAALRGMPDVWNDPDPCGDFQRNVVMVFGIAIYALVKVYLLPRILRGR